MHFLICLSLPQNYDKDRREHAIPYSPLVFMILPSLIVWRDDLNKSNVEQYWNIKFQFPNCKFRQDSSTEDCIDLKEEVNKVHGDIMDDKILYKCQWHTS